MEPDIYLVCLVVPHALYVGVIVHRARLEKQNLIKSAYRAHRQPSYEIYNFATHPLPIGIYTKTKSTARRSPSYDHARGRDSPGSRAIYAVTYVQPAWQEPGSWKSVKLVVGIAVTDR